MGLREGFEKTLMLCLVWGGRSRLQRNRHLALNPETPHTCIPGTSPPFSGMSAAVRMRGGGV